MQSPLKIQDFIEFEDLFKELSNEINSKEVRKKLTNEDLVKAFQKLQIAIDQLLSKAGRKLVVAASGSHSSVEIENIQTLCTKMLTLFQSQFVGEDSEKPAKLYEFLDQMKDGVISSHN